MSPTFLSHAKDDNDATVFPPPPPPLSTTISNMQTATHTFRTNTKLTGNAVPRPYPGSPVAGGSSSPINTGGRLSQPTSPLTPTNSNSYQQTTYDTSTHKMHKNSQQQPATAVNATTPTPTATATVTNLNQVNRNLEACVQDLHDKTFGQGGVVQITSNSSYPGHQSYEGYTSRLVMEKYSICIKSANRFFKNILFFRL